jgi:hypothetical protein
MQRDLRQRRCAICGNDIFFLYFQWLRHSPLSDVIFFVSENLAMSFPPALSRRFAIWIALGPRNKYRSAPQRSAPLSYARIGNGCSFFYYFHNCQFYPSAPLCSTPQENRYWNSNLESTWLFYMYTYQVFVPWCTFGLFVMLQVSVLDMSKAAFTNLSAFRALRAFRPLRVVSRVQGMRVSTFLVQ